MNCEWTRANTALYIYDELKDDERYELERHVERCSGCKSELEAVRGFRMTMSATPLPEPSPNLLASSRMRLSEALESEQPNRGWRRFTFDFAGWLQSMKFAPALTAALLMVGFAAGVLTAYQVTTQRQGTEVAKATAAQLTPLRLPVFAALLRSREAIKSRFSMTRFIAIKPRAQSTIPKFSSCYSSPRGTTSTLASGSIPSIC